MSHRKSGVLLHITSLPDSPGIGTLGKSAYAFVDWLCAAGQTLWQVLPLGPTGYGDSPYSSFSTFAGNPLLVDLLDLVERGWADAADVAPPEYIKTSGSVDYGSVVWWKFPVLYRCAAYFLSHCTEADRALYEAFKNDQSAWLNNFADYTSIKKHYDAMASRQGIKGVKSMWNQFWPRELASHDPAAVSRWNAAHAEDVEQIKVVQFFFFAQWRHLKAYANKKGVSIVGDIPIFVAGDSADVWANQNLFQIDKSTLLQKTSAGVPPDYFSSTGQLWGNPLYDWEAMKADHYSWWVDRIKAMLNLVDIVRIDHFRGFEAYWQIPYGAPNAIKGAWVKGPAEALFNEIKKQLGTLPIIAEDLGVITPEVEKLRDGCGFPGMKILQFAFDEKPWTKESARNENLPANFASPNVVVYTGTHDNDTTAGFFASCRPRLKKNVLRYFELEAEGTLRAFKTDSARGSDSGSGSAESASSSGESDEVDVSTLPSDKELTERLVEAAFNSCAETCIVPMQDVYALGSAARMNTPSTTGKNWAWRMDAALLDSTGASRLAELSRKSGRNL